MTPFRAILFDGQSSRARRVVVRSDGETVWVHEEEGELYAEVPLRDCRFEPPLGRTGRSLALPDGARCHTSDAGAFAGLERRGQRGLSFVHLLESRWPLTIGCLVALLLFAWGFTVYGVPALAYRAAFATPQGVLVAVSEGALEVLDRRYFEPSELRAERAAALQRAFEEVTRDLGTGYPYRLELRRGGDMGANALALPSGIVVVTDELVALSRDDRGLASVLAHEVAHVEGRHGLRSLYGSAGVYFLVATLFGDVTSVTSVAGSLPALLVETGYSRGFEREADRVAGVYGLERGWGTEPLRVVLVQLAGREREVPGFLSTHPGMRERLALLEGLEARGEHP